jgi:glutathione S-transferase
MALNPKGTTPILTLDGAPMTEAASILRYLALKHESLHKFYPEPLEQRQRIDAALEFHGTYVRPIFVTYLGPKFMKAVMKRDVPQHV